MSNNINYFLDKVSKVASSYKANINPELTENLSKIYEINKKYKLPNGTEVDFNNAATFFLYSVIKNSQLIEDNENEVSYSIRDILKAYYEKSVTDDQLEILLKYVYDYNRLVDEAYVNPEKITYSIDGKQFNGYYLTQKAFGNLYNENSNIYNIETSLYDNLRNICIDIFGINPDDLSIKENSYSHYLYKALNSVYFNSADLLSEYQRQFLLISVFAIILGDLLNSKDLSLTFNEILDKTQSLTDRYTSRVMDFIKKNTGITETTFIHPVTNISYPLVTPITFYEYYLSYSIQNPLSDNKLNIFLKSYSEKFIDYAVKSIKIKLVTNNISAEKTFKLDKESNVENTINSINTTYKKKIVNISKIKVSNDRESYIVKNVLETTYFYGLSINIENLWSLVKAKFSENDYNVNSYIEVSIVNDSNNEISIFDSRLTSNDITNNIAFLKNSETENIVDIRNLLYVYTPYSEDNIVEQTYGLFNDDPALPSSFSLSNINSLYSFVKNKFLSKTGTSIDDSMYINNNLQQFNDLLNTYRRYYKIIFEPYEIKEFSQDTNFKDLLETQKRSYSSSEAYYVDEMYNMNILMLENLIIPKNKYSKILKYYKLLCEEYNYYESKNKSYYVDNELVVSDYYTLSFSVLYKELNSIIRQIDFSETQNMLVAFVMSTYNTNDRILSESLIDSVYNITYDKIKPYYITEEDFTYFKNLKTNDYIIRASREADIVAYLSGDIIDYGTNSAEINEINLLKKIYTETRDYFYKVLLNKSFIMDEYYKVYENFFIVSSTIERFISSKIENITSIDLYNDTDCSNFLKSYGLSSLDVNYNFTDSLLYKKRIIANYNALMSQKGSRAVIDELFKIFDYKDSSIQIYKYLLVKSNVLDVDGNYKSTVKFVEIPYDHENENYFLENNENSMKDYDSFIEPDPYWKKDDVPVETVENLLTSPQITKYIGVQLEKNIYNDFINSRLALSLNNYLSNNQDMIMYNKGNNVTSETNILNFLVYTQMYNNTEVTASISTLYHLIRMMYLFYIYYSEGQNKKINFTANNTKYLGINTESTINDLADLFNKNFYVDITKLFKAPIVDLSTTARSSEIKNIEYFFTNIYSLNRENSDFVTTPITIKSEDLNTVKSALVSNNSTFNGYLAPLTEYTKDSTEIFAKNEEYNKLRNNVYLHATKSISNSNMIAIADALSSVSIVNMFNKYNKIKSGTVIEDFNDNLTKSEVMVSVYAANTVKKQIINASTQYNDIKNLITNASTLAALRQNITIPTFYNTIYSEILSFPLNYLSGMYSFDTIYDYSHDTNITLENIFEKFYLTENPGYFVHNNIKFSDDAITRYKRSTKASENTNKTLLMSILEKIFESVDGANQINNPTSYSKNTSVQMANSILEDVLQPIVSYSGDVAVGNIFELDIDTESININIEPLSKIIITNDEFSSPLNSNNALFMLQNVQNKIIELLSKFNDLVKVIDNMSLNYNIGENVNNFFDFIKTSIEFFISYTANLYESNLVFKYDTKFEKAPLSYSTYEKYTQKSNEYFYYDEDIEVEEKIF